jgi:zinc D-Ala-D-Ala carboxypeptidase
MTSADSAPTTSRRILTIFVASVVLFIAACSGGLELSSAVDRASPSVAAAGSPSSVGEPSSGLARSDPRGAPGGFDGRLPERRVGSRLARDGALGKADGVVPDGVTVFDGAYPAVSRLDPALLAALRRAAADAGADGVALYVDSGWRSAAYQEELFRDAVAKYGSNDEAARWVASARTSAHVSGDAVDIGHADAVAWLSEHGARYGLCQIYRNEPWHYELRAGAVDHGCPEMYADAAHDPRLRT